jgi:hypothetical protein
MLSLGNNRRPPAVLSPMTLILLRRALAIFLPVAALAVLCCGLVYAVAQQELRSGANEPQLQLAEDAARALDAGRQPDTLVGSGKVDVAASLAPFLVIFDRSGRVLATDGRLDGHDPVPPLGVLDAARTDPPNAVTWQPRAGIRVATVSVPWTGGTVLAGRSLRDVERQEDVALFLSGLGLLVMLGVLALVALLAARLWPAQPPDGSVGRSDRG